MQSEALRRTYYQLFFPLIIIGIFFSCKKLQYADSQQVESIFKNEKRLSDLKVRFELDKIQEKLTKSLRDSISLVWRPDWKKAYEKKKGDSLTYFYVPLNLELFRKGTNKSEKVPTINNEEYLICTYKSGLFQFLIGTYSLDPSQLPFDETSIQTQTSSKRKVSFINHSISFQSFTGIALLTNLLTGAAKTFTYKNGTLNYRIQPKGAISNVYKTNSEVCRYMLKCYYINLYSSYCLPPANDPYANSGYQVVITEWQGIEPNNNDCMPAGGNGWHSPLGDACSPTVEAAGSDVILEYCTWVDDPPLPNNGSDNGNNGSGGATDNDNGTPTDPTHPDTQTECYGLFCNDNSIVKDPRLNCIFDKLLNQNAIFDSLASGYKASFKINLRYTKEAITNNSGAPSRDWGQTEVTTWASTNHTYEVRIKLNTLYFNDPNVKYIDLVRTIFHETWHAELYYQMLSTYYTADLEKIRDSYGRDVENLTTAELIDLLDHDDYGEHQLPDGTVIPVRDMSNGTQHDYMARHIDIMARGITEFLTDVGDPLANNKEFAYATALSTLLDTSNYLITHLNDFKVYFPNYNSVGSGQLTFRQYIDNVHIINRDDLATLPCAK